MAILATSSLFLLYFDLFCRFGSPILRPVCRGIALGVMTGPVVGGLISNQGFTAACRAWAPLHWGSSWPPTKEGKGRKLKQRLCLFKRTQMNTGQR
jgi:hypothetical protein